MTHGLLKEKLFALYDGELPEGERQEVLVHLDDCPECRQVYKRWEKIAKTFFRPPMPQTSEAFVQRVMERVETLTEPERVRRRVRWSARWIRWQITSRVRWRPIAVWWLVPALGLAAAALLLFISLQGQETLISTEDLLLADGHERSPSQWILVGETPQADDLLGIIIEGL